MSTIRGHIGFVQILTLLLAAAIELGSLSVGVAQVTLDNISGVIFDESGAAIPGANLQITSMDTGISRYAVTDVGGQYHLLGLAPAYYRLRIEKEGFKSEVRENLHLSVGHDLIINVTLKVGDLREEVAITRSISEIQSSETALSGIVDDKEIRNLPLNARSFIQLSFLQPGVSEFSFTRGNVNQGRGAKMSVEGLRPTSNSFLLDGTYVNDAIGRTPGSTAGVFLGIDTVREFRVLTNSYSAEYGLAAGGIISAVTKAGTNALRGTVFYFHRNDNLDARNFFDLDKPEFRRHQFGFTLGGPIRKDRTFFFGAAEWLRQAKGITTIAQVPSLAAHNGQIVPIADVVKPYLSLFPLPNGPDLGDGLAEHRFLRYDNANEYFYQARLDHEWTGRDSLFGRFSFDNAAVVLPSPTPNTLAEVDEASRNQYLTLEYRRILSTHWLSHTRLNYTRSRTNADNRFLQPIDPSLAFIPGHPLGNIRVGGIGDWGPNRFLPVRRLRSLYGLDQDIAYAKGHHSIRFGATLNRIVDNNISSAYQDGAYEFHSISDFLSGSARTLRVTTEGSVSDRSWLQWLAGFYIQNELRATHQITINMGLRYEFTTILDEANNRLQSLRDVLHDADVTLGAPLYLNPSLRNFSPRIGVAWDPFGTGKTAIRAGFGMFFDPYLYAPLYPSHQNAPPFVMRASIRNPVFPVQELPEKLPNSTQSMIVSEFTARNPYAIHYNLTVQRESIAETVLTLSFAGSRGVNLLRGGNVNRPVPQVVGGRLFFPAGSPRRNPNWGDIDYKRADGNSWYNALQVSVQRRLSRGLQFQIAYTFSRTIDEGSGIVGDDLSTGVADPQDTDNRSNERGLTSFHQKHRLTVNYSYSLPFETHGKGWAGLLLGDWQLNGILTARSGSPFTIGIESDRARAALRTPGQLRPDVLPGTIVEDAVLGEDAFRETGLYFDPYAFTLPPEGFLGNLGRNTLLGPALATFDASLVKTVPARILGENGDLQLRIEFFNITNRANFSPPNSVVFTGTAKTPDPSCPEQFECPLPTAGRITSTVTDARQIQFGLKLHF